MQTVTRGPAHSDTDGSTVSTKSRAPNQHNGKHGHRRVVRPGVARGVRGDHAGAAHSSVLRRNAVGTTSKAAAGAHSE
jgi:hypothetical protein